jgi:hypothetical protein
MLAEILMVRLEAAGLQQETVLVNSSEQPVLIQRQAARLNDRRRETGNGAVS